VSSGIGLLSERAGLRLVAYCRRMEHGVRQDWVWRPELQGGRGRSVPYSERRFRSIVWADAEVRDALLNGDHRELVSIPERYAVAGALGVLQLMCDMSLEGGVRRAGRTGGVTVEH